MASQPFLLKLLRSWNSRNEPSGLRQAPASAARWPRLRRRARRLKMIETLSLGDRRVIAVVQVDGRELLVGSTLHSMTLLGDLSADESAMNSYPASGLEVQ
ncbi:MAG TPA: flagellar biosynthetic protein FliO [Terriglobales bacterium]|nr:flagellar biosynthetic protein FliO [Terriglobales bacterium]